MEQSCNKLQARIMAQALEGSNLIAHKVTDTVYLGGQPEREDWQRLANEGFSLIINVRSDPERAAAQAQSARAAGLNYIHLQIPAYELEGEHIQAFAAALAQADGGKTLVHCRTASRVALLWMLKRMVAEQWSQEQAEAELQQTGYSEEDMEVFRFCAEDFLEREQSVHHEINPAAL